MTSEGVTNRITRLLTANVHALLGSLENRTPQAVLDQYLREFDEVIGKSRLALGQHEAARHRALQAIARANGEIEKLDARIAAALEQGDEAAARAGTERQIDLEDQLGSLNASLRDAVERSAATESALLALRAKRDEMAQALAALTAANTRSHTTAGGGSPLADAGAASQAERLEQGFNRAMASATGMADLGTLGSGADAALLRRLEVIHKEQRISERLARLKAARNREAT